MTSREMQEAVEIELRQQNPDYEVKGKMESKEIFHFLTRAERDFVQDVYNDGIDRKEENKKKLGKLLSTITISSGSISDYSAFYPNGFLVTIPDAVLYVVNERAKFTYNSVNYDNIFVKPISFDEYSKNKDNPFRKPNIEKCLRLEGVNQHIILTQGGTLTNVYLDYVKTPLGININQVCELHENVHLNIVKSAVKLINAAKENQIGYQLQHKEEIENK